MQPEDVADAVRARLAAHRARGEELRAIADLLPVVVRDWQVGGLAPTAHPATEVLSGADAQWEFWDQLLARTPPRSPVAVFPDLGLLLGLLGRLGPERAGALTSVGTRSRVLTRAESLVALPPDLLAAPALAPTESGAAGIELRTIATAPGWLYVDADGIAVLPLHWEDPTPESIVVTREPAIVAALAAFFDELWLASSPLPGSPAAWDPVLTLLGQGLSDSAIASALGWSLRTVRRRIAEASRALGASSRFALGVEWERRR